MPVFLARINQYQDVNVYTAILKMDSVLQLVNLKKSLIFNYRINI